MSYEAVRAFADSWGLVLLVILFLAVVLFIFRRGSTERYRHAARIPMEAQESRGNSPNSTTDASRGERPAGARQNGEDKR